jgi:3-hydroxyisobutyrate dehydrogenase-like beta-hydroxyacid dehydrogenase
METIGFIGLGNLGLPMATNLLKAGYPVTAYNRSREKAKPLEMLGANIVNQPEGVAKKGIIVITLVSDDNALREVSQNLAKALGENGLHISMSTVSADTNRDLAEIHKKAGAEFIAAPIFGRPEAIAAKAAAVCISGSTLSQRQRATTILKDGAARVVFDFGDETGATNVVKLIGNFMIASSIEMMAEAFALAEKNGIEVSSLYDMLTSTIFSAPVFQNYGRIIMNRSYYPAAFRIALGLKDVNLVLSNAEKNETPMPMAKLVQNKLQKAMASGKPENDWSSFAEEARKEAGLA